MYSKFIYFPHYILYIFYPYLYQNCTIYLSFISLAYSQSAFNNSAICLALSTWQRIFVTQMNRNLKPSPAQQQCSGQTSTLPIGLINMPATTYSVPNRTNIHLTWLLLVWSQIWIGTGLGVGTGSVWVCCCCWTGLFVVWLCVCVLWCGHFLIWFRYLLSHTFYYLIYQSSC